MVWRATYKAEVSYLFWDDIRVPIMILQDLFSLIKETKNTIANRLKYYRTQIMLDMKYKRRSLLS